MTPSAERNPADYGIVEAAGLIANRSLSSEELVSDCLDRIASLNPRLGAFILVMDDDARRQARRLDRELRESGPRGPLHGVPVAIKDMIDIEGAATTAHSRIAVTDRARRDAVVVTRLREAGAVLIGKTALHEFATGGPSFDLPWPPARNPWRPAHHPGGSSSGSAVAVATGMAPGAIGTDTAGSVRHPATACGIVGLKPTYGAVSTGGVFPLSASLDHVGPLARSVRDCAMLYTVIREKTVTSRLDQPIRFTDDLDGMRIGVIEEFGRDAAPEIRSAFSEALGVLQRLGAVLVTVEGLPPLAEYTACGRLILQAESYAVHADWLRERPLDYGERGRVKLLRGAAIGADALDAARRRRLELTGAFERAMENLDAAVCVSSLELPCAIDDAEAIDRTYDSQARTPFNVTGSPAIAIPNGFSTDGLPIGMQVVGRRHSEQMILRIAHAYEQATPWRDMRPPPTGNETQNERTEA